LLSASFAAGQQKSKRREAQNEGLNEPFESARMRKAQIVANVQSVDGFQDVGNEGGDAN
jgi:hypothetical protein